ncbi:extracellular solute-binding protein [Kineosporia sp. NBRC 101731]|uniref:ABC transporter substrate-binding protein n=1 Tax=Kineosporia sp. NBRC 101731 TaxID=3032199 RepID=UPI0024A0E608|nr:extracellular solute-binding protein [Kineosporia sp. NBRC 101731]GLY30983.1 sugar ABC transporter substrate-binding protein [Kineosporia sp. NBRC 101731]
MTLTRRTFLSLTGAAGLAGALAACGEEGTGAARSSGKPLTFWCWDGALSEAVVKNVTASFVGRADITTKIVPGDFGQRLTTTLSAGTAVPDITGVKGEDMPVFLTLARYFLDLNTLGAREIADSFAPAKYAQAATGDGKQLGLPIDLGPTALFLRADLWKQAGLPIDVETLAGRMSSWEGWFECAHRLRRRLPGTFAIRNSTDVFAVALSQQAETFIARDGGFVGDGTAVRTAWDLAVRSITEELQAGLYADAAFGSALEAGVITGHLGPAWNGLDIASVAPGTFGSWRVAACPGGPGDIGGSYLTLPATCRDPELAFAYIRELLTPQNEGKAFADAAVFPAVPAAYSLPALTAGQPFYGGQSTIEVFGPAAEQLPTVYDAPGNAAIASSYVTELANVEGGKNPESAWQDAVSAGRRTAEAAEN